MFPELFPPGGGLNTGNRWLKLGGLIPWERLEEVYRKYFSEGMGRPAKDSRLICGLRIVKHAERYSDERAVLEYLENPYVQALCGEEIWARLGPMAMNLSLALSFDVAGQRRGDTAEANGNGSGVFKIRLKATVSWCRDPLHSPTPQRVA